VPYVICARCNITTYSAALHATLDTCPSCGERPPARPGGVPGEARSIASQPRFARDRDGGSTRRD